MIRRITPLCILLATILPGAGRLPAQTAGTTAFPGQQGSAPAASPQQRQLGIYRADGSLQCQPATGIPTETMAAELTARGVTVRGEEQRVLPIDVAAGCGLPTGKVSYYIVALADLEKVNLDTTSSTAFRVWAFGVTTVPVVRGDAAVRCGAGNVTLASGAKILADAGIVPIERLVRSRGGALPNDCAKVTDVLHVFVIPLNQLPAARRLRFNIEQPVPRSAAECVGVVAPEPGTPTFVLVVPPVYADRALPDSRDLPAKYREAGFETIYYISATGISDSVTLNPAPPADKAKNYLKDEMKKRFRPAMYQGCPVAGTATIRTWTPGGRP